LIFLPEAAYGYDENYISEESGAGITWDGKNRDVSISDI
jgi:hypothetical protein